MDKQIANGEFFLSDCLKVHGRGRENIICWKWKGALSRPLKYVLCFYAISDFQFFPFALLFILKVKSKFNQVEFFFFFCPSSLHLSLFLLRMSCYSRYQKMPNFRVKVFFFFTFNCIWVLLPAQFNTNNQKKNNIMKRKELKWFYLSIKR